MCSPFRTRAEANGRFPQAAGSTLYGHNDGRELFYETLEGRIMVVDYTVQGDSFMPGKPRAWCDKQLFYMGSSNMDLAPDGRRFVVLIPAQEADGEKGSVHITMLLNFFDELKRRIPAEGK